MKVITLKEDSETKKYNHSEYNKKLYLEKRNERLKQIKEWQRQNKDKIRERKRKYEKEYTKRPEVRLKKNARSLAFKHIVIPLNQICVKCKKELAAERHHEDYDKKLKIDFVCSSCHKDLHGRILCK